VIGAGAVDLARLAGAQTPEVRNTLEAIQTYFPSELARHGVSLDHIQLAVLLGNQALGRYLLAISAGSVLFGANTYIGNAPNFMVKLIAERHGAPTPTSSRVVKMMFKRPASICFCGAVVQPGQLDQLFLGQVPPLRSRRIGWNSRSPSPGSASRLRKIAAASTTPQPSIRGKSSSGYASPSQVRAWAASA
jgi:hypothetical protein